MKKYLCCLITLLIPFSVLALPLGNPLEPSLMIEGVCLDWEKLSFRAGFYGDYVFNNQLKLANSNGSTIHQSQFMTNAGYLIFNFCNRLDLFATFGATNVQFQSSRNIFNITPAPDRWLTIETETGFSWSLGTRAALFECRGFALGAEFQYFRVSTDLNFVRSENSDPVYLSDAPFKYWEWQVGLGVSYLIPIIECSSALVPYMGVKGGKAKVDMDDLRFIGAFGDTLVLRDLDKDRPWGYVVGLTLLGACKWTVTAEGRFLDEKALHINSQFRF